jgi:predicted  nucleic acid-binding Zn-ribbon protein
VKRTEILAMFAVLAISVTMPAFSQVSQSDSQILQAILSELRGLHRDMRVSALSQILLTELQTQQTVVNAANERVNGARLQLSNLQADEKLASAKLASSQEKLTEGSDPTRTEALSEGVAEFKSALTALKAKDEGLTTNLQMAESQLRSAQDTLDDIQQRLEETVKKLQPIADTH